MEKRRTDTHESTVSTVALAALCAELHYSPKQLGELWGLSPKFIRDTFSDEPGVLRIDRPEKMHKRSYCSLRIPKSVACRVHLRVRAK